MKIPPDYKINSEIFEYITKIEANRIFISLLKIPFPVKQKLQRVSILRSSLFSARIEGNPLTIDEVERGKNDEEKKKEVFNILRATEFIDKTVNHNNKVTKKLIQDLHSIVMENLTSDPGLMRREMSAIFNQAGVAVYMTPPPEKINLFIDQLLEFINSDEEKFPLITAFIAHLVFEKIHPFIDGNGRVGRLLVFLILKSKNQDYGISIPFEEYLDRHKEEYYYHMDHGIRDVESYLIFMFKAFLRQTEEIKKLISHELEKKETIFLPPRQEEIYNIIRDHNVVSFDTIRRRFLKVPPRTLRYNIKKLQDSGYVIKIGNTRGSYYRVK